MTQDAVKANPTHSTLDAKDHEDDLEEQRRKRKDSSLDFTTTPEGAEIKKRNTIPTQTQDEGNQDPVMPEK